MISNMKKTPISFDYGVSCFCADIWNWAFSSRKWTWRSRFWVPRFSSCVLFIPYAVMLLWCGSLVNGPYALITTAVSADLVRMETLWVGRKFCDARLNMNHTVSTDAMQGTHESLRGNSRALSTVTAIIDGTGSIGEYIQRPATSSRMHDLFAFSFLIKNALICVRLLHCSVGWNIKMMAMFLCRCCFGPLAGRFNLSHWLEQRFLHADLRRCLSLPGQNKTLWFIDFTL